MKVYLTFDDGPSDLTPEVLDLLDKYDAKATFFVVYTDDEEYTSYLKEILDRGHTIALHSYSHNYNKIYKSVDAFLEDFEKLYNWVYEETGVRPALFRFLGGSTKGKKSVVNDIILENVCTNIGSFDQPVVLMHDGVEKNKTYTIQTKINFSSSKILVSRINYTKKSLKPHGLSDFFFKDFWMLV